MEDNNYLNYSLVAFAVVGVFFLIWWFFLKDDDPQTEIISHEMNEIVPEEDDAPPGYDRYYDADLDFEFFHREDWNISERDFGNTQTIEQADLPFFASTFDLSYFKDNDARVVIDLPKEKYCQQSGNLNSWRAFEDSKSISDKNCTKPGTRQINGQKVYTFEGKTTGISTYAIFLQLLPRGGMVFSDTVPVPAEASASTAKNIIDNMKTSLHESVNNFILENQKILPIP